MTGRPSYSINLGLPAVPDIESQELYAALMPIYSALRNVMGAVDTYTGNNLVTPAEYAEVNFIGQLLLQKQAILYVKLTEDVNGGSMINLHNSGGLRARKANVSSNRAHAYAVVKGITGDVIPVCMFGLCQSIAGLTAGTDYYLSNTSGLITSSVTAQRVGIALSSTALWFTP